MVIRTLECSSCEVRVEGRIPLSNLSRLPPDLREFAELYLLAGGSLKALAQQLGVSYPLVRNRLDRIIAALTAMRDEKHAARMDILDDLETGVIDAEEAARKLRRLPESSFPPSPES